ncbi:hypothetical protein [Clostridium estertheticum]|uniref:hypothetical protein n=1 Tax=Clostridium estertheticum TaxID=238834 RepID=UPI001C6E13ED|nr:hypothetical protein [Clostridium estertheticum]MBW9153486.1 hypothetical protein [Clostridium estertheticum]WLC86383.1 hypothetical protein KTC97_21070 [Clostridium estertheticum]
MKSFKKNWWKVILIVFICVILDLILHTLAALISSSNTSIFKPSIFVKHGLLKPSLFIYAMIDFGIMATVFVYIQDKLPNKKWVKGFLYGISFGGLFFVGMFEGILLWNDTLFNSFLMGLVDFIPILLMGTLLGVFTGTNVFKNKRGQNMMSVFVIALCFIIGRYFSYTILHITSAYNIKPLGTFIWTLCQGLWVGIIYFILQSGIKGKSVISQSLFFGVVILGLNWLMYHFFIAIIVEVSVISIFIRVGMDLLFIMLGVFVYKKFLFKR